MAAAGGLDAITALREALALPPGPFVVALSGGADSAVCAWAALDTGATVRAIFVDHGFPESSGLGVAARDVAAHLGIELDEIPITVPRGPSPEDPARRARHRALEEALKPDETLLSGHTADDQAETVLGNLIRGAGAGGVAGIPRRRGRWLRPLLGVDRTTIRAAAADLGLPFADDPTNESTQPRRNLIRHDVMPVLEQLNPRVVAALGRAADHAASDTHVLDARAASVPTFEAAGVVKVPAAVFAALPPAVAARVARKALRTVRGPYPGTADEIDAISAAAAGASATLPEGLQVLREGPFVVLVAHGPATPEPVSIVVPGITRFWTGEIEAEPAAGWRPLGAQVTVVEAGAALEVTTAASDDRISIGDGSKSVSDALSEAGVPRRLRPQWPVVKRDGMIIWIVGVRAAPASGDGVVLRARLETM